MKPYHLVALLLAVFVMQIPGVARSRIGADPTTKIGDQVLQTMHETGQATVVIALNEPPAVQAGGGNLAQVQVEVAALQGRVLAALPDETYVLRQQFRAVPALALTLQDTAGLHQLAAHPDVRRIDLDVGGTGALATSVPLVGASTWHAVGIGGQGVVVAVLDSGIDRNHPDLAESIRGEACFLDTNGLIDGIGRCPNGTDRQTGEGAASDDAGHGTHVSGIITSNGFIVSPGVAPGAALFVVKVLDNCSFSGCFSFFSEIIAALDLILTSRPDVQVINMSLGTSALFVGDCDNSAAFNMAGAQVINALRARGTITFASAGNDSSSDAMSSPACLSNVVAVGATDNEDVIPFFSNISATTDILAPGVATVSAAIGSGQRSASGTSMASPHAAGCAALLIEAGEAITPDQIEARLKASPILVTDPSNGVTLPRIDCRPRVLSELFYLPLLQ